MRVKCVLCDKIENINSDTLQAKRLRNRPIHTYMCEPCNERIADKTNNRIATGNFKLYRSNIKKDDW
ncbi:MULTISPECIES: YlaI family protein [Mesobacillus]|uniref:YlaI family protein n=1 Tax=Mesobacillus selenatarsenatis TaxID=388741 RepID=A0A846TEU9_9BACI|nr:MULTISPECIES: YlaI family protein [Mesobacillus]NKE05420.1 YlaI family protein [Mesobacillus selenatarsenatis]